MSGILALSLLRVPKEGKKAGSQGRESRLRALNGFKTNTTKPSGEGLAHHRMLGDTPFEKGNHWKEAPDPIKGGWKKKLVVGRSVRSRKAAVGGGWG